MRIIRPGKEPRNKEYRTTCGNCDCHFEFVASEAKEVQDQRDGDYLEIACPTCGHAVTVTP